MVSKPCPGKASARKSCACPEEPTAWVGTVRGKKEPVHIASEGEELVADLKQKSFVRPTTTEGPEALMRASRVVTRAEC